MNHAKMMLSSTYGKNNKMTDFHSVNAASTTPTNSTSVSAKLPEDLFTFIENYRWDNRLTKTQVVIDALGEWAKSKGFIPQELRVNEETPS